MRSKQSSELHGTGDHETGALHQCLEGPTSGSPASPLAYFPIPVLLLSRAVMRLKNGVSKVILEQPKCVLMRAKRGRRARLLCAPGLLLPGWSGLAGSAAELQLEAENGSTRGLNKTRLNQQRLILLDLVSLLSLLSTTSLRHEVLELFHPPSSPFWVSRLLCRSRPHRYLVLHCLFGRLPVRWFRHFQWPLPLGLLGASSFSSCFNYTNGFFFFFFSSSTAFLRVHTGVSFRAVQWFYHRSLRVVQW